MPTQNAPRTPATMAGTRATVSVTALAPSTARRRGTAATVVRIMPEVNSRAPTRAPSVPTSSTAKVEPVITSEKGSAANPPGPGSPSGVVTAPVDVAAARAPKPTSTPRMTSIIVVVERTDQSLIHSERSTCQAV